MNKKLYFSLLFVFFGLLFINSAYSLNDALIYYSFDDGTITDLSGNGYTGSNIGTTNTSGVLGNARNFDGVNDYINIATGSSMTNTGEFTIAYWLYLDSTAITCNGIDNGATGSPNQINLHYPNSNGNWYWDFADTSTHRLTGTYTYGTGSWQYVVFTSNSTHMNFYRNGALITSQTKGGGNPDLDIADWQIGLYDSSYCDGKFDEWAVWTRDLSLSEIQTLYNSGSGYNPYSISPTPTINHNITDYYNSSNISISLNTTSNVNMSYVLDGGSEISIANNTNNTILNLNSLSESLHTITLIANDENGETNTSVNFTVDLTKPNISIIGPITQDFEVNFSTIFNVTDNLSGLASCVLDITYLENVPNASQYDQSINCTDTTLFYANGLYNGFMTAIDNAGNTETLSINGTIQSVVFVNFYNIFGEGITNYNAEVTHPSGYIETYTDYSNPINISPYFNNSLDLGNYTIEITKEGYFIESFTLPINLSSGNETFNFNLTLVTLLIKAYDLDTLNQISFNVLLENSTDSAYYISVTNFSQYYNETITGDITVTISKEGYSTNQYLYTINPYTSINLTAYLNNETDTTVHQFTTIDQDTGLALGGVELEIQQLINGTYTTIATKVTGDNGKTYFNLISTEEYKVILSKNGYVTATANTIPTVTEYTVKLTSSSAGYDYIDEISYSFKPTGILLNDNQTYNFQAFISGAGFTKTNITIYLDNGTIIYTSSSTNPSGTTYNYIYNLPYQVNISNIFIKMIYQIDGQTYELLKEYQIMSFTNSSFLATLNSYSENTTEEASLWRWFILMFATMGVIIFGAITGATGTTLLLIPLWAFASMVNWISWVYAGVVIFLTLVTFIGGKR